MPNLRLVFKSKLHKFNPWELALEKNLSQKHASPVAIWTGMFF